MSKRSRKKPPPVKKEDISKLPPEICSEILACKFNYIQRDRELRRMGFRSYDDYLKSELWSCIRNEVLRGAKCKCCGGKPKVVHHQSYDKATLHGVTDKLVPVCHNCHELIEFKACGSKRLSARRGSSVPVGKYNYSRQYVRRRTRIVPELKPAIVHDVSVSATCNHTPSVSWRKAPPDWDAFLASLDDE